MALISWTREENEQFKNVVLWFSAFFPNRFERMARCLRKSVVDVMEHYQEMVDDLQIAFADGMIGAVAPSWYRTVRPIWDKEEHEWFLIGLRRFERDCDKIAALLVTKTPMQVAVYARNFFTWHNSENNVMKRRRTVEITMGDTSVDSSSLQENLVPSQPQPQQGPVALGTDKSFPPTTLWLLLSYLMGSMPWTRDEDKLFERLLLVFPENFPNRFETIAIHLQKPLAEVKHYYEALVHDINLIESGRCRITNYQDEIPISETEHMEKEKKRGQPWTEEEHRYFLEGLDKYGRGDWKKISRERVKTRTPTQVASHAQKYFLRQEAKKKAKKRSSIHDITLIDHAPNNVTSPQSDLDSMMGQPLSDQQVPHQDHHHSNGDY